MKREVLAPKGLWDSTKYHFSQAIRVREFKDIIMISGQTGITEDFQIVEGLEAQATLSLDCIKKIITEAGGTMENIVKLNVYFLDVSQLSVFEKALAVHFPNGKYPAQTAIEVKALALPPLLIEIEAMVAL
jgi:enamine deaminase RidA (YjgF/YER057c/UK114 family)